MPTNIFKSRKDELCALIRNLLAEGLPPLFRVHRELINRADPVSCRLSCSPEELAETLGYDAYEVKLILNDLASLDFIEYYRDGKENGKRTIKVLVR